MASKQNRRILNGFKTSCNSHKKGEGGRFTKMADYMTVQTKKLNLLYPFLTADQIRRKALDGWNKFKNSNKYRDKVKSAVDVIRNSPRKQKDSLLVLKDSVLETDSLPIINQNEVPLENSTSPPETDDSTDKKLCEEPILVLLSDDIKEESPTGSISSETKDAFDDLLLLPNSKTLVNITPIKSIRKSIWTENDDDDIIDISSDSDIGCELQVRHDSCASESSSPYQSRDNSPLRDGDGTNQSRTKVTKRRRKRKTKKKNGEKSAVQRQVESILNESSPNCGSSLSLSSQDTKKSDSNKEKKSVELRRIAQPDSDFVRKALEMMDSSSSGRSRRNRTNNITSNLSQSSQQSNSPKKSTMRDLSKSTKKKVGTNVNKKGGRVKKEVFPKTDSESQNEEPYSLFSSPKKSSAKKKKLSKKSTPTTFKQTKISRFFMQNASDSSPCSSPFRKIPGSEADPDPDALWTPDEASELELPSSPLKKNGMRTAKTYELAKNNGVKRKGPTVNEGATKKRSRLENGVAAITSPQGNGEDTEGTSSSVLAFPIPTTSEQDIGVGSSSQESNSSVRRSVRSTAGSGLSAILSSLKSRSPKKEDKLLLGTFDLFETDVSATDSDRSPFHIDDHEDGSFLMD